MVVMKNSGKQLIGGSFFFLFFSFFFFVPPPLSPSVRRVARDCERDEVIFKGPAGALASGTGTKV